MAYLKENFENKRTFNDVVNKRIPNPPIYIIRKKIRDSFRNQINPIATKAIEDAKNIQKSFNQEMSTFREQSWKSVTELNKKIVEIKKNGDLNNPKVKDQLDRLTSVRNRKVERIRDLQKEMSTLKDTKITGIMDDSDKKINEIKRVYMIKFRRNVGIAAISIAVVALIFAKIRQIKKRKKAETELLNDEMEKKQNGLFNRK